MMARKKSKQQAVGSKDAAAGGQQGLNKSSGCAAGGGECAAVAGGGDATLDRHTASSQLLPLPSSQPVHTCCLLCHREFKECGASLGNGLPSHGAKLTNAVPAISQTLLREVSGRKLADALPSLSQSLLGEVPLWICPSCRKSVEEEEMRAPQEQMLSVPLSHSSSCKAQNCGNGYSEQSSVEWDPSSFLSAHKLSGLWNSSHNSGPAHCNHSAASRSQVGPAYHEKRSFHEASSKSTKATGTKVCPYSHPGSPNSNVTSTSPLSTTSDLCKTTPKHFKTMCCRSTPPGEAFHSRDHHQHSDLAVPPNSPTGMPSQHSSLIMPKQAPAQQAYSPNAPLVPSLHVPVPQLPLGSDSPSSLHKSGICKNSHISTSNTQHMKSSVSLSGCNHLCNGHSNGSVGSSNTGHLPPGSCRDQACKGQARAGGTVCHPACELEEGEDEDSSSERSSCASSSTNQKDGKYCDCCYCEFFGHNAPPAAPTSRNYAEIREKLRSRLTRRKEELPQRQDSDVAVPSAIDHRDVDELLDFINSSDPKPINTAKAAKRARHKQKKKEKEKAQQCSTEASLSDPRSSPCEHLEDIPVPAEVEPGRLLEWPQLELERVNSFLTSRLEEIKNTIKDSIRASFSMYDLNLDVNDFPKKAATLDGNHLLSHVNGSSDLQQIDLDLSPLTLSNFKNHLVSAWEDSAAASQDVHRLQSAPSLSKVICVHPPEGCPAADPQPTAAAAKTQEELSSGSSKSKKGKKQQPEQDQQPAKVHKAASGNETRKNAPQTKTTVTVANSKMGNKAPLQPLANSEAEKVPTARCVEEVKPSKQNSNGTSSTVRHLWKSKAETQQGSKPNRLEVDGESKNPSLCAAGAQQPKAKSRKNKNKVDKTSSSIDDVFLPKDVDPTEMDEIDREVEYFKRFCLDSAKQTRQKVSVNWSNFSLKKVLSNAAQ